MFTIGSVRHARWPYPAAGADHKLIRPLGGRDQRLRRVAF
jgi:hypothetical protein